MFAFKPKQIFDFLKRFFKSSYNGNRKLEGIFLLFPSLRFGYSFNVNKLPWNELSNLVKVSNFYTSRKMNGFRKFSVGLFGNYECLPQHRNNLFFSSLRNFHTSKLSNSNSIKKTLKKKIVTNSSQIKPLLLDSLRFMGLFYCILEYGVIFIGVVGESMYPTLRSKGDLLLVDRFHTKQKDYKRGDVVIVQHPFNVKGLNKVVVKRIVGLPGDVIQVPSLVSLEHTNYYDPEYFLSRDILKIPKGHVWIQGDNIKKSRDSRHYGPVPMGLILGKALCKVYPPEKLKNELVLSHVYYLQKDENNTEK